MITRRQLLENGLGTIAAGTAALSFPGALAGPAAAQSPASAAGRSLVPRSKPPARSLMVASVAHLPIEEQTALCVMQGLVNRVQPRVFLIHDVQDAHWLNWLRQRGDIDTVKWVGPYDVLHQYRDQIRGCIVTDPSVPATVNVATFLGGLKDAVAVAPQLVEAFHLPIIEDLRGRWKRNVDAYRWAYREFPSANQSALAHLNPFSSRLRDYMAQFQIFTFWLSGTKDQDGADEIALARELFERVGPNVPVLGWWGAHGQGPLDGIGEQQGVDLASEYGLLTVCMAWDGYCEGTTNLSVHSGTTATFQQRPAPPPPPLEDKVYYSFLRTDGDGPNFWRLEFPKLWWEPQHGHFPMNWPIGPLASEFIPDIMDFFYKHASANDYFMAAVSGIGYIHEDCYGAKLSGEHRKASFDRFLRLTSEYMSRMDLHYIHTFKTSSDELARQYAHAGGVQALFLDYNRNDATTAQNATTTIDGIPVFRTVLKGSEVGGNSWAKQVENAAAQVRMNTPTQRPAFLSVTLSNWVCQKETQSLALIQELERQLAPEYKAVRADHLVQLYKTHASRPAR